MYLQLFGYNRNLISSYCTPRDRHKKISLNNHKPIPRSIETTSSCTYLFMHISIRAHIYSCIYLFVHISIRAHIYSCIYLFVHISIRAYIYSCIYLFVHISIRTHIYSCTNTLSSFLHTNVGPFQ